MDETTQTMARSKKFRAAVAGGLILAATTAWPILMPLESLAYALFGYGGIQGGVDMAAQIRKPPAASKVEGKLGKRSRAKASKKRVKSPKKR